MMQDEGFVAFCKEKDDELLKEVDKVAANLLVFEYARKNQRFTPSFVQTMRNLSNNDINDNLVFMKEWAAWEITTEEEFPHKGRRGISKEQLVSITKGIQGKKRIADTLYLLATGMKGGITPIPISLNMFVNKKRVREEVPENMTQKPKVGRGRPTGPAKKEVVVEPKRSQRNTSSNVKAKTVDTSKAQPTQATDQDLDDKLAAALTKANLKITENAHVSHPPPYPSPPASNVSSSISTTQFSQLSDALTEVNKDVKGINSKVALIEKSMQEASMVDKLRMQVTRLTAERVSFFFFLSGPRPILPSLYP